MNLVDDPWIPVIGTDGESFEASLKEVFSKGDEIADLAANPCQRIALMRLLICIAQAALDGPKDEDDWRTCRPRLGPAALAYLEKWRETFNLFGDHAFLQVDGLEASDNALTDKLDLTLACGNNPTLFDHAATPDGRIPENAQLALSLLVYQILSPGGLIGSAVWSHQDTGRTSEHAPCLEGSMLHTFLRAKKLTDTIHLNMLTRQQISSLPNAQWGKPCWEIDDLSMAALEAQSSTYLGRLVAVSRAISCAHDARTVTLASGIRYQKLPEYREPTGTVKKLGKGTSERLAYVAVNPQRLPWRELGSILALQDADKLGGALSLNHLREIDLSTFDIWTGGLCAEKAKLIDMAEWMFSLPRTMLDTLVLQRYQNGVTIASDGAFVLKLSIKQYADTMKSEAVWVDAAQCRYWTAMDKKSSLLTDCAVAENDLLSKQWIPLIRAAMRAAYAQTCPHETPRQIQAYAQGLKVLDSFKEST